MPRDPRPMKTTRLNLDIPSEVRARMEEIQRRVGALSLTEVIKNSLAVYDLLTKEKEAGSRLWLYDSEGEAREVLLIP